VPGDQPARVCVHVAVDVARVGERLHSVSLVRFGLRGGVGRAPGDALVAQDVDDPVVAFQERDLKSGDS
jgi:hypothetical protein